MVVKKEAKLTLSERLQKKISHAVKRSHITEQEIYALSREYFRDLLQLQYEFTHDELLEEIKKTYLEERDYAQVEAYVKKLGVIEFASGEYEQNELKLMLHELEKIVLRLSTEKKKKSWLESLKEKILPKKEEKKTTDKKVDALRKIITDIQLRKGKKFELYHQAIETYEQLGEADKAVFYTDLLGIYYDLKKAHKTNPDLQHLEEDLHIKEETPQKQAKVQEVKAEIIEEEPEQDEPEEIGPSEVDVDESIDDLDTSLHEDEIFSPLVQDTDKVSEEKKSEFLQEEKTEIQKSTLAEENDKKIEPKDSEFTKHEEENMKKTSAFTSEPEEVQEEKESSFVQDPTPEMTPKKTIKKAKKKAATKKSNETSTTKKASPKKAAKKITNKKSTKTSKKSTAKKTPTKKAATKKTSTKKSSKTTSKKK